MRKYSLSEGLIDCLICPNCKSSIVYNNNELQCIGCGNIYHVIKNIPIILSEENSIFGMEDIINSSQQFELPSMYRRNVLREYFKKLLPDISSHRFADEIFREFNESIHGLAFSPKVLVVGGRIPGRGMAELLRDNTIEFVEGDIFFGPRTSIIFDAHDVPFQDSSFDGVIIQAVLEHVVDPYRCVDEIVRVLKTSGIVYAETSFMQQVHGGRYDFTRFTHLGHRRLFKHFEEIKSGAIDGPGSVLAWAYQYFLLSFAESNMLRNFAKAVARMTSFWFKYFDRYLMHRPGSLDAASAYFFLGKKSDHALSDKDLITQYRGAQP